MHLSTQANLLYQLDCLAGAVVCARDALRGLWAGLGLDAADEAALAEWRALRSRYVGPLVRNDRVAPSLPLLMSDDTADVGARQRIAGWLARDAAQWQLATALLSTPADAARLATLRARFAPRFLRWWRMHGRAEGVADVDAFGQLLGDGWLRTLLERAARFYGAELPSGPLFDLYVIVQPKAARPLQTAEELERWAVVAIPEGSAPRDSIDVVVHELCHYFFSRMAPATRATLLARFLAADDAHSAAAIGVMDKALAAAFGNGVVGRHYLPAERFARRLARDDGLVRYRAASLTARALLPSLETWLARSPRSDSPTDAHDNRGEKHRAGTDSLEPAVDGRVVPEVSDEANVGGARSAARAHSRGVLAGDRAQVASPEHRNGVRDSGGDEPLPSSDSRRGGRNDSRAALAERREQIDTSALRDEARELGAAGDELRIEPQRDGRDDSRASLIGGRGQVDGAVRPRDARDAAAGEDEARIDSSEFVRTYLAAAAHGWDGGPLDYLHSGYIVAAPELAAARDRFEELANAHPPYSRELPAWNLDAQRLANAHPQQSLLVLSDSAERLDVTALGFEQPLGPGAWAHRRTPKSWAFVLIAHDAAGLTKLVEQLTTLHSLHEGRLLPALP